MSISRKMKCVSKCAVILAALAMAVPGFSGLSAADPDEPDPWTIALYICADNNLEACWDTFSVPMLWNLPDNPLVNVVAWVDRLSTTGYEIVEYSGEATTTEYSDIELDFGSSDTLRDFIKWSYSTYPCENYCLVMWDHGSAWKGFSVDETDGSRMYGPDFDRAVREADIHIDVLGFDACSMSSMERMYEISYSGYVDYMAASEELVPGNGLPYDLQFGPVIQDPSRTPLQLAGDMVLGWEAYYGPSQRVNFVATDLRLYRDALDEFAKWTSDLANGFDLFSKAYNRAVKHAYTISGSVCQADLLDIAQLLYEELGRYPASPERTALADSTLLLKDALEYAVKAISTGSVARDTRGISIWWSWAGTWDSFGSWYVDNLWFTEETQWDEFLELYNE